MKRALRKKNCQKGDSCGYTCISKLRVCRKELGKNPSIYLNANIMQRLAGSLGVEAPTSNPGLFNPKKPESQEGEPLIIGKCSSPSLTEEQRARCLGKNYNQLPNLNSSRDIAAVIKEFDSLSQNDKEALVKSIEDLRAERAKNKGKEVSTKKTPQYDLERIFDTDPKELANNLVRFGVASDLKNAKQLILAVQALYGGDFTPSQLKQGKLGYGDQRLDNINANILNNDKYPAFQGEVYITLPNSALKKGRLTSDSINSAQTDSSSVEAPGEGKVVVKVVKNTKGKDITKVNPYADTGEPAVYTPPGEYKVLKETKMTDAEGNTFTVYEVEED